MEGTPSSLKTDRESLIKDNLGRYCPKTFETAKDKKKVVSMEVKPRLIGLWTPHCCNSAQDL